MLLPDSLDVLVVLPWRNMPSGPGGREDPLLYASSPSVFLLLPPPQISFIALQESLKQAGTNSLGFNICTVSEETILPCSSLHDVSLEVIKRHSSAIASLLCSLARYSHNQQPSYLYQTLTVQCLGMVLLKDVCDDQEIWAFENNFA